MQAKHPQEKFIRKQLLSIIEVAPSDPDDVLRIFWELRKEKNLQPTDVDYVIKYAQEESWADILDQWLDQFD